MNGVVLDIAGLEKNFGGVPALRGARFDVRTGAALCLPAVTPVPTFEVKVEGDDIYIEDPDAW